MTPIAMVGALTVYLVNKKKDTVGEAVDGKQVTENIRRSLLQMAADPIWSDRSKQIIRAAIKLLPPDVTKENNQTAQARYDLLKKLPESERADYTEQEFVHAEETLEGSDEEVETLAALDALLTYLGLGGRVADEVAFYQQAMGMDEEFVSGKLDTETILMVQMVLSEELGTPVGSDIFGIPVLREFGIAPATDHVGWKVRLIRGTKPFVRQRHANSRELIGGESLNGWPKC